MTRNFKNLSLAFLLLAGTVCPAAAQDDPAGAAIQNFYDALTASMKAGGPIRSRYEKLKPAVEQDFDLSGSMALSVGPTWSTISAADQKALTDAFERLTIANYVRNFDSFHGEKFIVDPNVSQRGTDKYVRSTLKPASGDPVAFNYRLHQVDGSWKIVDIYLAGNISQLAEKRSEFAATLASGGPEGLAKQINATADRVLD